MKSYEFWNALPSVLLSISKTYNKSEIQHIEDNRIKVDLINTQVESLNDFQDKQRNDNISSREELLNKLHQDLLEASCSNIKFSLMLLRSLSNSITEKQDLNRTRNLIKILRCAIAECKKEITEEKDPKKKDFFNLVLVLLEKHLGITYSACMSLLNDTSEGSVN